MEEVYNAEGVEFDSCNEMKVMIEVFRHGSKPEFFVVRKRMPYYLKFIVSEDTEMAKRIFNSTMSRAIKNIRRRLEFLAAINRIESINDYTYYLTKNYWTFVCISDSIFI